MFLGAMDRSALSTKFIIAGFNCIKAARYLGKSLSWACILIQGLDFAYKIHIRQALKMIKTLDD